MKNLSQKNNSYFQLKPTTPNVFETEKFSLFEDILNDGLTLRVKVTGSSMIPFLNGGEFLIIKKVPYHSLHRGDLILFKNRYDLPIIHRIIRKKRAIDGTNTFQTKGDALIVFDAPVHENEVIGKVCRIEKIASNDNIKQIDMESGIRRKMNHLIALINLAKSKACFGIFRFYKVKTNCPAKSA